MTREIKFRAWDGQNMREPQMNMMICSYSGGAFWQFAFDAPEPAFWKVMQYTGVKDKNGVEIYEGDIVEGFDSDGILRPYQIKWCEAGHDDILAFHPIDRHGDHYNNYYGSWIGKDFSVIGNIHENPELLHKKEPKNDK